MRYEIFGGNLPAVTAYLEAGESVYTQSGGLAWMTERIEMDTNMPGGFMQGLGRLLTGESLFMVTYTARGDGQSITFASKFPGSIIALDVASGPYICQKSAFLAAEQGVKLSASVTKSGWAGLAGGEGFMLQELSGTGRAFLELDGSIKELYLNPGEKIKVSGGNVAAFEKSVEYSVETVKGVKNILFSGEGLFLTQLKGPGKVYLQTMTAAGIAGGILPFIKLR